MRPCLRAPGRSGGCLPAAPRCGSGSCLSLGNSVTCCARSAGPGHCGDPGEAGSNHRAPDPAARTCLSIAATRHSGKQSGLLSGFLSMSNVPVNSDASGAADVVAEVYWRPGCPYCSALRRDLSRRGVPSRWHNIWTDPDARAFVRSANSGSETVPTVRIGATTLTNPRGGHVATLVTGGAGVVDRRTQWMWRVRWILSWLPTIALLVVGEVLTRSGHPGIGWGLDAVAVGAWWLTRPLRR